MSARKYARQARAFVDAYHKSQAMPIDAVSSTELEKQINAAQAARDAVNREAFALAVAVSLDTLGDDCLKPKVTA